MQQVKNKKVRNILKKKKTQTKKYCRLLVLINCLITKSCFK